MAAARGARPAAVQRGAAAGGGVRAARRRGARAASLRAGRAAAGAPQDAPAKDMPLPFSSRRAGAEARGGDGTRAAARGAPPGVAQRLLRPACKRQQRRAATTARRTGFWRQRIRSAHPRIRGFEH
jgi:hypothetical protein